VEAGYRPNPTSAGRLERRPHVAARLAELRERDPDNADPAAVVVRLLRLADACAAVGAAPALKEARLALMDAHRIQAQLSATYQEDEYGPIPPVLSEEEWIAKYCTPQA
jgi:hypothetical protein